MRSPGGVSAMGAADGAVEADAAAVASGGAFGAVAGALVTLAAAVASLSTATRPSALGGSRDVEHAASDKERRRPALDLTCPRSYSAAGFELPSTSIRDGCRAAWPSFALVLSFGPVPLPLLWILAQPVSITADAVPGPLVTTMMVFADDAA